MQQPTAAEDVRLHAPMIWGDWQWYLVLLIALAVRGGWGYGHLPQLSDDPDAYRRLAVNVIELHSYTLEEPSEPTAFRPPLYPLLLALTSFSGRVQAGEVFLLHTVLGVVTVGLTFVWCRQMGLATWRFLAALLVAVDPILLNQSGLLMTETLATCLAVLTLVAVAALAGSPDEKATSRDVTIRSLNVAGAIMLAVYCRPSFLVWAVCLAAIVPACFSGWQRRATGGLAFALTAVFLLMPWALRNWLVFESPVVATTHGGYTLLWGNNREFYEYLRHNDGGLWDMLRFTTGFRHGIPTMGRPPANCSAIKQRGPEALETMRDQPLMAAYSAWVHFTMFWRPLPHATSAEESMARTGARWAVAAFYGVEFALAILGLIALGKHWKDPRWLAALTLVASLTLVHLFYWSNIRMRAPLVPVLAVLACVGLGWLLGRWRGRRVDPSGALK